MQTNVSEVAQLQEQIAAEYMAAKLGLLGLNAGTGRHDFITARQERIGVLHEQLQGIVGDTAIALVAETLTNIPDTATRSDVLMVLRYETCDDEERELLCTRLQEAWKTIDLLKNRFGDEQVCKILLAPSSEHIREIPPS